MTPADFKSARKALGLSQRQLADELQIGERTVQKIEGGEGCTVVMALAMERLIERNKA